MAVGFSLCPTVFRKEKLAQGALGLAYAAGASRAGKPKGGQQDANYTILSESESNPASCTNRTGDSPCGCSILAEAEFARQELCSEVHCPSSPCSRKPGPQTYATLLGLWPDRYRTASGAVPLACALFPPPPQRCFAPMVVPPCPQPRKIPLPRTLARRLESAVLKQHQTRIPAACQGSRRKLGAQRLWLGANGIGKLRRGRPCFGTGRATRATC